MNETKHHSPDTPPLCPDCGAPMTYGEAFFNGNSGLLLLPPGIRQREVQRLYNSYLSISRSDRVSESGGEWLLEPSLDFYPRIPAYHCRSCQTLLLHYAQRGDAEEV